MPFRLLCFPLKLSEDTFYAFSGLPALESVWKIGECGAKYNDDSKPLLSNNEDKVYRKHV